MRKQRRKLLIHTEAYSGRLSGAKARLDEFITADLQDKLNKSKSKWDTVGSNYIKHAYAKELSQGDATLVIICIMRLLGCTRAALPRSWELLHAWRQQHPGKCRTPCPKALQNAITAVLFAQGLASTDSERILLIAVSLLVWLAFEALLRPIEVAQLRRRHLVFSTDVGGTDLDWLVVVIASPKNRRFMGHTQFVMTKCLPLILLLHWLCEGMDPEAFIFPGSRHELRTIFKKVLEKLGIHGLGLTWGSLRPGGATEFFRTSNGNVAALLYLGRWASQRSLSHYLQEAMSAITAAKVPNRAKPTIHVAGTAFALMKGAPPCPLHSLWARSFSTRCSAS
jgi:hypothetical protein